MFALNVSSPTTSSSSTSQTMVSFESGTRVIKKTTSRADQIELTKSIAFSSNSDSSRTTQILQSSTSIPSISIAQPMRNSWFRTKHDLMANQTCVWRFEGLVASEKLEFNFSEVLLEQPGDTLIISANPFEEVIHLSNSIRNILIL